MTHFRLPTALAAALCLVAGHGQAQNPYGPYGSPMPPPMQGGMGPQTYYSAPASPGVTCAWTFSVADGAKLQIQTADGVRSTCERMTLQVSSAEPVLLSVTDKQVLVQSAPDKDEKNILRGTADRVMRSGAEGGVLTLEGNAKLKCVRQGKSADLVADRIVVHLMTGHVEAEIPGTQPVSPVLPVVAPAPCIPTGPACGPSLRGQRARRSLAGASALLR